LAVACSAFSRLATAGNHEAGGLVVGSDGEGKSVQRRLRRRIDGRTDIAARNRVHLAVEQAPFLECHDITLVEFTKALFGKLRGRAQLACAKRRQWPPRPRDQSLDLLKTLLERHEPAQSHALDGVPRQRRDAAGILKHGWYEAVS